MTENELFVVVGNRTERDNKDLTIENPVILPAWRARFPKDPRSTFLQRILKYMVIYIYIYIYTYILKYLSVYVPNNSIISDDL